MHPVAQIQYGKPKLYIGISRFLFNYVSTVREVDFPHETDIL